MNNTELFQELRNLCYQFLTSLETQKSREHSDDENFRVVQLLYTSDRETSTKASLLRFLEVNGIPLSFIKFLFDDVIYTQNIRSLMTFKLLFSSDFKHYCKFSSKDFDELYDKFKKFAPTYQPITLNKAKTLIQYMLSNADFFRNALRFSEAYTTLSPVERALYYDNRKLKPIIQFSMNNNCLLPFSNYKDINEALNASKDSVQAVKNLEKFFEYAVPELFNLETILFVVQASPRAIDNLRSITESNLLTQYKDFETLKNVLTKDDDKKLRTKFNF